MPTGYTDTIKADTTLEAFALTCARAFGALIMMRDDPSDVPIPEGFQADTYHRDRAAEARIELAALEAMSMGEVEQAMISERANAEARLSRAVVKSAETRARYERVLAMVNAWEPPTPDHEGLKAFMQKQITESIDFDCMSEERLRRVYVEPQMSPAEWIAAKKGDAARAVAYQDAEHAAEVKRASERTAWVKALRESVAGK